MKQRLHTPQGHVFRARWRLCSSCGADSLAHDPPYGTSKRGAIRQATNMMINNTSGKVMSVQRLTLWETGTRRRLALETGMAASISSDGCGGATEQVTTLRRVHND